MSASSAASSRRGLTLACIYTLARVPGSHLATNAPSNLLWGVKELEARGHRTRHFYPSAYVPKLASKVRLLGYLWFFWRARKDLARCDALYLYSYTTVAAAVVAKCLGVLPLPIVFIIGGLDIGRPRGRWKAWNRIYDRFVLGRCARALFFTSKEALEAQLLLKLPSDQVSWLRFAVDAKYYAPATQPRENFVLVVGNDGRDWATVARVAAQMPAQKFVVLTQLSAHRHLSFPPNVEFHVGASFGDTARWMSQARLLLLATLPNDVFRGLTTVLNSVMVGTPVVLDEAYSLFDYNLVPGESCLAFSRGRADEAVTQVRALLTDEVLWRRLHESSLALRDSVGMERFAEEIDAHLAALRKES